MTQVDAGLQPPRTALAWNRTALAALANAALLLRAGVVFQRPLMLGLGIGLAVLSGSALLAVHRRQAYLLATPAPGALGRLGPALVAGVLSTCAAGAAVAMLASVRGHVFP